MNKAGKADESLRKELVTKAASRELQVCVRCSTGAFRKFNTLLNVTLNNRGLLK
jgi:hypothetical protein